MRARLDALAFDGATVTDRGDELVVRIPGLDPDAFERARASLARRTSLGFHLTEPASAYVHALADLVRVDPEAARLGITAHRRSWSGPDGMPIDDELLSARDLPALRQYIAAQAAADVGLQPALDRFVGYEPMTDGTSPTLTWATLYLERQPRIDGGDVAEAKVVRDPQGRDPQVQLDLDADGTIKLGELTAEANGRKIAIVVDGAVVSAPVVHQPISGGRAVITMGAGDAAAKQRDAERLVANLEAGALPAPLIEVSATLSDGT